ncbi:hypothetical protein [Photobacterium sp. OFAV2-7]|uniref:hypothetical protein n=1 Tax=Photobacterium sp. OFAV2-7 TaxID=2917748 RepID=UPI001EF60215|nr:hypothetical protein [Photobacterium sp. OFAV2-7]MCG7585649.1 hypothetical protein [Photobacterium sp. OFAV2-7]
MPNEEKKTADLPLTDAHSTPVEEKKTADLPLTDAHSTPVEERKELFDQIDSLNTKQAVATVKQKTSTYRTAPGRDELVEGAKADHLAGQEKNKKLIAGCITKCLASVIAAAAIYLVVIMGRFTFDVVNDPATTKNVIKYAWTSLESLLTEHQLVIGAFVAYLVFGVKPEQFSSKESKKGA